MWPRLSIARLLAYVAALGLGLASLRSGSLAWVASLLTACLVILTMALVAAICLRGRRRAFWAGFSLAGWLYLTLSWCPGLGTSVGQKLATTAILDLTYHFAYPYLAAPKPQPKATNGVNATETGRFGFGQSSMLETGGSDRGWYKSLGLERDFFGWGTDHSCTAPRIIDKLAICGVSCSFPSSRDRWLFAFMTPGMEG